MFIRMSPTIYHTFCKTCDRWIEVEGLEENHCAACGSWLPSRTEGEALLQELKYYSGIYQHRRKMVWQAIKILTVLVCGAGLITFAAPDLRGVFFIAVFMYLTLVPSLFFRTSYQIDANFNAMWENVKNPGKLSTHLGTIFRLSWKTMPYQHLDERLNTAQRLDEYLRKNERLL
jgi:hypothetical protein